MSVVPPRLLHVFATFVPGGPQVRTAQLMGAMAGEFEHLVVAMDGLYDARSLVPAEVGLRVLEPPPRAGTLRTVAWMRALLAEQRPDLLLTYNWGAIEAVLAARFVRGLPVLHHEDGFRPDEAGSFKLRRVLFRRWVLRRVCCTIVPSRTLERIALELWRQPSARVSYIPNGIRPELFRSASEQGAGARLRTELSIPPHALVVGAVGHLRPEKNFARLLEAFAALRKADGAYLLLCGDGPQRPELERISHELGLADRVRFAGHRTDLPRCYAAMDVFAISSDTEQMPIAQLEAMAAGLTVVGTDVGDVRSILSPSESADLSDSRLIVPLGPGSERALAAALDEVLASPELRRRIGAANRARVERSFSFDTMVAAYRTRYSAALGTRRTGKNFLAG